MSRRSYEKKKPPRTRKVSFPETLQDTRSSNCPSAVALADIIKEREIKEYFLKTNGSELKDSTVSSDEAKIALQLRRSSIINGPKVQINISEVRSPSRRESIMGSFRRFPERMAPALQLVIHIVTMVAFALIRG